MKRTTKVIVAILTAVVAVGVFVWALQIENRQTETTAPTDSLIISEFMASNSSTVADENGNFADWIEISNPTDQAVSLSGYGLSNEKGQIKYLFPSVSLKPGGYLLVFATSDVVNSPDAVYLHTGFKLSASGGEIYLTDSAGQAVDAVAFGAMQADVSMGRDAAGALVVLPSPTPGFSNDEAGEAAFAQTRVAQDVSLLLTEVMPSNLTTLADADGDFSDYIELYNAGSGDIALAGFSLSDNPDNLMKWRFPEMTISPGQHLVVFASGKDKLENGQAHTNFRISSYMETVVLCDPMGRVIDEVSLSEMAADSAKIRVADTAQEYTDDWEVTDRPSPGYMNNESGYSLFEQNNVVAAGPVVINEVMPVNSTLLQEEDGGYYDWIEVYNRGTEAVNIGGYSLSDDTSYPTKWRFPDTVLEPGEYLVVMASGLGDAPGEDNGDIKKKYIHTNFALNASGEVLALYDANAGLQDRYRITAMPRGVSMGREDGENVLFYYTQPTPGEVNDVPSVGIAAVPVPSVAPGSHEGAQQVGFTSETTGAKIYYTLDGTEPTQSDNLFIDPIPVGETGMIRARAYQDGYIDSDVASYTYFIGETHTLPLLSIVTDPDNLWNEQTGIYAMGPNAADEYPFLGANFHENWEKPASFEVFDESGAEVFAQNVAIRIQGGFSRGKNQKSFAIFARTEYGPGVMAYPFFDNRPFTEYASIQLRNGGQDQNIAKIKEATLLSLAEGQGFRFINQAFRPYVLYLNGEYWGVYFMQEKRNEAFIAQHEGVADPDTLNILKATSLVVQGSNTEYKALLDYIESHDMSKQENFDYIAQYIDTDSFMDVMVNQVWIANSDYGNMEFYRIPPDGKWKQIYYDFCWTFNSGSFPDANHPTLAIRRQDKTTASTLFNGLLSYQPWRDAFIERMAWALKEVYNPDRVIEAIDTMHDLIADEMPAEREKFGGTIANWEGHVDSMRDFARKRGANIVQQFKDGFSLTGEQLAMLQAAIEED